MNTAHHTPTPVHGSGTYVSIYHTGLFVVDDFGNLQHFEMVAWLCNTGVIYSTM